jgi:hypothetical protein
MIKSSIFKKTGFLFALVFLSLIPGARALTLDEFGGVGSAVSSVPGAVVTVATSHPSAVGGFRVISAEKKSFGAGQCVIETFPDPSFTGDTNFSLGYTQGAHTGQGIISWDGNNSPGITPNGLGSVDLTQDGGSSLRLGIKFFDYPSSQPIDITFRLYDASGTSSLKYSDLTVTLNKSITAPLKPFEIVIPFSLITTSGTSSVPAPDGATFKVTTVGGPVGLADITRIGAIQMILNGLQNSNAPDIVLDFLATNGRCSSVPNAQGRVIDECGVCLESADALKGKDSCGVCRFGPPGYSYTPVNDGCGLCPSSPTYGVSKDPCGVCFGDGTSCADCKGKPNGSAKVDICGVCGGNSTTCLDCAGQPFGKLAFDACGVCGGVISDVAKCSPITTTCTTVQASGDILEFEKKLSEKANKLAARYRDEERRSQRNKCGIDTKDSTRRVRSALQLIQSRGKEIFTSGVEVCGNSCVTVSYADEVTALSPQFQIMERETVSLARKVKECYRRKKIRSSSTTRGVSTTLQEVRSGLQQLIRDCKDRRVCPG